MILAAESSRPRDYGRWPGKCRGWFNWRQANTAGSPAGAQGGTANAAGGPLNPAGGSMAGTDCRLETQVAQRVRLGVS